MADSPSPRRKLQQALRARDKQIPSDAVRLADALWNNPDRALDHTTCLAALPAFVSAEVAGAPVAKLYPAIKRHLDRCDSCAVHYSDLLQAALADANDQLPQPTRAPKTDLSFLPPLRDAQALVGKRTRRKSKPIK